jgi:hypothetical protein
MNFLNLDPNYKSQKTFLYSNSEIASSEYTYNEFIVESPVLL